ncbi:hypothetical protein TB2_045547 [Malus domestica]
MGCNVIWRVKARMTKRARPSGSKFIRHHAAIITIQVIKSTPSTSKIIRHPAAIITNQVIKSMSSTPKLYMSTTHVNHT